MKSNYDITVEQCAQSFLTYDQEVMIKRLGLEHDENLLYLKFFGSRYAINRKTGVVSRPNNEAAGFNEALTIYDILCYSKEGARLSGEWITLECLHPSSNFGSSKPMHHEFAQSLSGKIDELRAICQKLGGVSLGKGDVGYVFAAFEFLPLQMQFWDADEDFEASIRFMFDTNSLDFLHFETAWYVAGHLIDLIKAELE